MTVQALDRKLGLHQKPNGFILLEVLVAMSLIMGSWMIATNAYHSLALNLGQQESKRSQLRKEMDAHEIAIQTRTNTAREVGSLKNDAPRMLGWNHALHPAAKSAPQGKRPLSSQANGI